MLAIGFFMDVIERQQLVRPTEHNHYPRREYITHVMRYRTAFPPGLAVCRL